MMTIEYDEAERRIFIQNQSRSWNARSLNEKILTHMSQDFFYGWTSVASLKRLARIAHFVATAPERIVMNR